MWGTRSYYKINYKGVQFIVAHHPPGWAGTDFARNEHLRELRGDFAPWTLEDRWKRRTHGGKQRAREKSRILLWDRNMVMPEFRNFADSCDARPHGVRIDCGMTRRCDDVEIVYGRRWNGHSVHTDHPWGAAQITFTVS
jgi:hypothetical protein